MLAEATFCIHMKTAAGKVGEPAVGNKQMRIGGQCVYRHRRTQSSETAGLHDGGIGLIKISRQRTAAKDTLRRINSGVEHLIAVYTKNAGLGI